MTQAKSESNLLDEFVVRYGSPRTHRGKTSAEVLRILREAVLDGYFTPGSWLREEELAAAMGVSRTPVRDALNVIAEEGLVKKHRNAGAMVTGISFEEVLQIYDVRERLESLAAASAAASISQSALASLEEVQREMTQLFESREARPNRSKDLSRLNMRFHEIVRDASRNGVNNRLLAQMDQMVRRIPWTSYDFDDRTRAALCEHDQILDALRRGDGLAAGVQMATHMRNARMVLAEAVTRIGPG